MTPILTGRWQTRFLLLSTIGLAVTLLFGRYVTAPDYTTPLAILGYVLIFGFAWDWIFIILQRFRWDRDWPPVFQLSAGIWEGIFVWSLIQFIGSVQPLGLAHLPGITEGLTASTFILHYSIVWGTTFLATQGPLRVLFPRWRFYGGEWI